MVEEKHSENGGAATQGWIGVDLDGTLAVHGQYDGVDRIGKPVKPMVKRIQEWLDAGLEVRVFTARASEPSLIPAVKKWLGKHRLGSLEVTNQIDRHCLEIWDDRAVRVVENTGNPVRSLSHAARPAAPILEEAFPHENRPKLDGDS